MTTHYERWADAYCHYIDEWYDKLILLFNLHGYYGIDNVPTRAQFYQHCYRNTRRYWDPKEKKNLPTIVLTPRAEEEEMEYLEGLTT